SSPAGSRTKHVCGLGLPVSVTPTSSNNRRSWANVILGLNMVGPLPDKSMVQLVLGSRVRAFAAFRGVLSSLGPCCKVRGGCTPPIRLSDQVANHADLFLRRQLRGRVLDQVQFRLRLAVHHHVQPVVLAEPLGLDPLVRR